MPALPSETCDAVSDRGFESWNVLAGVGDYPTEARMHLTRTRGAGYLRNVAGVEAAAGQYRYAIACLLDERSENRSARRDIGSAARSQNANCASESDVFEGHSEIFCFVKSAVKRYLHLRGESDEFTGALLIYRTIWQQYSSNDALHLCFSNRSDFLLHPRKFS